MGLLSNGQENSDVYNFSPDLYNNPSMFSISLGLSGQILILWVVSVIKILNLAPKIFPTVVKCPKIADANKLHSGWKYLPGWPIYDVKCLCSRGWK